MDQSEAHDVTADGSHGRSQRSKRLPVQLWGVWQNMQQQKIDILMIVYLIRMFNHMRINEKLLV